MIMNILCPKALNDLNMFDTNFIITSTIKYIAHKSWRYEVSIQLFSKFDTLLIKIKSRAPIKLIVITNYDKYTNERLLVQTISLLMERIYKQPVTCQNKKLISPEKKSLFLFINVTAFEQIDNFSEQICNTSE